MKQNLKSNKGFSLVELIIVIAIMAILVGVMAPQLIKYIEKTKVSSDIQLCDTIHTAILTACSDPSVISANDGSQECINAFLDPANVAPLGGFGGAYHISNFTSTMFYKEVVDTCGFDPFDATVTRNLLKSTPAHTSGNLLKYPMAAGSNNFHIIIEHSDVTGNKQDTGAWASADLHDLICVPEFK